MVKQRITPTETYVGLKINPDRADDLLSVYRYYVELYRGDVPRCIVALDNDPDLTEAESLFLVYLIGHDTFIPAGLKDGKLEAAPVDGIPNPGSGTSPGGSPVYFG